MYQWTDYRSILSSTSEDAPCEEGRWFMSEEQNTGSGKGAGTSKIAYFLLGLGVGSLLAVVFAPTSGGEVREFLQQNLRNANDYARKKVQQVQKRGGSVVDTSKKTIRSQKDRIAAAFEAGGDAYREEIAKSKSQSQGTD
jgi:gas vesicle protein